MRDGVRVPESGFRHQASDFVLQQFTNFMCASYSINNKLNAIKFNKKAPCSGSFSDKLFYFHFLLPESNLVLSTFVVSAFGIGMLGFTGIIGSSALAGS